MFYSGFSELPGEMLLYYLISQNQYHFGRDLGEFNLKSPDKPEPYLMTSSCAHVIG